MIRLKEIAELCNVSESTASKALNGKGGVKTSTRDRLISVASRYNYLPNRLVHSIQSGRTMTIGIASSFGDEFSGFIVNGILQRLFRDNYAGIIISWDLAVQEHSQVFRNLAERRADGVLMLPSADTPSEANLSELRLIHGPIVLVDQAWPGCPYDFLGSDDVRGGAVVTEHLIELGHRRIANLNYPGISTGRDRLEGFRQAMFKHGVAIHEKWLCANQQYTNACDEGYAQARQLLSQVDRPSAMVCYNDHVAVQAVAAALDLGLRVPEELSVTGFADMSISQRIRPRLTTVAQDPEGMGTRAADWMLKRVKQWEVGDKTPPVQRLLQPVQLLVRDSTVPPALHHT